MRLGDIKLAKANQESSEALATKNGNRKRL
jgi:hypothetical protein